MRFELRQLPIGPRVMLAKLVFFYFCGTGYLDEDLGRWHEQTPCPERLCSSWPCLGRFSPMSMMICMALVARHVAQ
jgi:hypothetical protein